MSNKVENFFRYLRNHELKLFLNINDSVQIRCYV
jgi:hypothetical protein